MAVRIEHPTGIPLAKNYEDTTIAYGGNLILLYEPPVAAEGIISIGVVCRINKTTISLSGTLESAYPGEPFVPSQELITTVRDAVRQMAVDIGEEDTNTMSYVIEEILNYCVINVPVKQIYEIIRLEYPKEYRTLNLEYKRRYEQTIESDMDALILKQQKSHRYGKSKAWTRFALKKNDIVTFNDTKLEDLRTQNATMYHNIKRTLEEIKPIKDKYIVFNDPQNKTVKLIGKNAKNPGSYARTDGDIPIDFLNLFQEDEEDDGLDWMTDEDKHDFGLSTPNKSQPQQSQNQSQPQQPIVDNNKIANKVKLDAFNIPETVYSDTNIASQYAKSIMQAYQWYIKNGYQITDKAFVDLVRKTIPRKPQQQPSR